MAGANMQQNNEMLRMMQLEELERQHRWILEQPPEKCPRCNSMDTKFCYNNNYSASQPRYICKACQRQWTKGGRIRDIPEGGSVRPARVPTIPSTTPDGDHVLDPQGQNATSFAWHALSLNPQPLLTPATTSTITGAPMIRHGRTIPLAVVNRLHGYYVRYQQVQSPLPHVMPAMASTLPPGLITIQTGGTGPVAAVSPPFGDHFLHPQGHNLQNYWLIEPENIFWFPHCRWVNGFWYGPVYGTSPGPLP